MEPEDDGWQQQRDNEERRQFEELLAADPDYERWVEQSYELHQSEQG